MTEITLFKKIALTNLPKGLFQDLEPYLESLIETYLLAIENEYLFDKERVRHLDKIKEEFAHAIKPNWLSFARERWPEIDGYFKLEDIQNIKLELSGGLPF